MSIKTARSELAAGITAASSLGVFGYARPPGAVGVLPAAIVQDPTSIRYHTTASRRTVVDLDVLVIVGRAGEQEASDRLDELVTYTNLPAAIEAITGASWSQIVVNELVGGYADFQQAGRIVGVAGSLSCRLTFTT